MDEYPDDMSKIALTITSAQLAKDLMVDEYGIGEDLAFTFFGWRENRLSMVVQLRNDFMRVPVIERIPRCQVMCNLMRTAWAIDAITLVAEGFETLDKRKLEGKDLRQAFVEGKGLVRECVTVTHCEINEVNGNTDTTVATVPYSYEIGRSIEWGETTGYTRNLDTLMKTAPVPQMLREALSLSPVEEYSDEELDAFIRAMHVDGFNIEEF
jgi:galactitol-specific phosphotransferase system IIB component